MRKRTQAREYALKMLYQVDITNIAPDEAIDSFWADIQEEVEAEVKEYSNILIEGVYKNMKLIDAKISSYAANWEFGRMAVVDRNVMRIACFELFFLVDIPHKVAINEAVDLAKKYSSPEAGKFVNGILDKIKTEKEKEQADKNPVLG